MYFVILILCTFRDFIVINYMNEYSECQYALRDKYKLLQIDRLNGM